MNRRAMQIDQAATERVEGMTDGVVGWRHHWRHGLVGSVQYWAAGCRANVVKILVGLADYFGVKDEVGQQLDPQRESVIAALAVARNVKGALAGLKPLGGSVEEQRSEYGVVLGSAFGAPAKAHDPRGLTAKIGRYLEVPVGARYSKKSDGSTEKREYASRRAQTRRAAFDKEVERQRFELGREPKVGDVVLSRGEQAVLVRFLPDGGCVLRLRDGNGEGVKEQQLAALYGNEPGSAHLTMPPLLVQVVFEHAPKPPPVRAPASPHHPHPGVELRGVDGSGPRHARTGVHTLLP